MATLISLTGTTSFDSAGKRRLAEQLGQMLSGYSLWYTVPVGSKQPVSCGREGQVLDIIKLPILRDKGFAIADTVAQRKLPQRVRKRSGDYHPGTDAIQVITTKARKGLKFLVAALPGVGRMPAPGEDEKQAV